MADGSITQLLKRACSNDAEARSQLMEAIYPELHRIAQQHLVKERKDHTLQPTALVHEAYMKMAGQWRFENRALFLAFASQVMRNILVDHARAHNAQRRGGLALTISLDDAGQPASGEQPAFLPRVLDLDRAIHELGEEYPNCAQSVEMRYFGGMTAEETAEATGRSVHVVQHELRFSRAWLNQRLAK